ncbi:crotonase/enoyl-CoA hydratase family protein [Psychromonas ossibalaenae]|uniref:crotonase/enoyl-CoA hydratase family protein n=1 Tax=Psychromonas ossibalaenae TaxID=444922 RepID=UPI0003713BA6|nr:crotonase/enoyl-CoA hydratase family protein [Psychromonas ossibalaenae]
MTDNLARMINVDDIEQKNNIDTQYSQLKTHYDKKYKAGWYFMNAQPRSCFTSVLLDEINDYQKSVKCEMENSRQKKYDYLVLASDVDDVFNLGGDLAVFFELIKKQDRDGLLTYATKCINVLHQNITHLSCELTTIALVQGDALGGGFEAALSSNVLIAERGTKLGLPEVLFNLFPGMGAYSLLSRKVNAVKAEEIILSGKLYSAEELYELGIVDILADKGQGETEVYRYIDVANRKANSYRAIRKVRDICNPVPYKELLDITKIWVESACELTHKDLRMMERLVMRQTAKNTQ